MKKWSYLLIAAVLLMASALSGCGQKETGQSKASSGEIVAKFSHVTAVSTPKGMAAQKFADLVKERTNGRVRIQVFPSSQLYGDKDEFEALQANNVQFIAPSAGKLISFDKRFQIGDMPFLFKDNDGAARFWDSEGGKKLLKSLESQGMVGITAWPNGMRHFMNSKKELKKPQDFKGLKFRIPAGGVLVDIFKALDAGTSNIPFADVYVSLQQKVVDGTIAAFDNIENEKYAEVLPYLTIANVNNLSYIVIANKKFWDGLPADVKPVIEQCMAEATKYERELSNKLDQESLEKLKEKVTIYEITPQDRKEFIKVMQPVWAKYEPVIGKDLFDEAKKLNQ